MKKRLSEEHHQAIARSYKTAKYTTESIANRWNLTVRQVQRIAKKYGVSRTQEESNKLMAPLKRYRKLPPNERVVRKQITSKVRYMMISNHPWCKVCGMRPEHGVRLEVDHINNDPKDNRIENLQVLCTKCNKGKYHEFKY